MATKSAIISDIILRLTKGKPADDLELEPKQVAYWIDTVLGSVVGDKLNKQVARGQGIESIFLKKENCIETKAKDLTCRTCDNNIYIEVCELPLSLHRDAGIIVVATEDGDNVDQAKWDEIYVLNKLKFSKPSVKNLFWSRDGKKLYLQGLTTDTMNLAQFMVVYVPKPALLSNMDDDDEVKVTDDVLEFVADEVEKIARRQMSGQPDIENDSQDDTQV